MVSNFFILRKSCILPVLQLKIEDESIKDEESEDDANNNVPSYTCQNLLLCLHQFLS